jgi:hypothetical protein
MTTMRRIFTARPAWDGTLIDGLFGLSKIPDDDPDEYWDRYYALRETFGLSGPEFERAVILLRRHRQWIEAEMVRGLGLASDLTAWKAAKTALEGDAASLAVLLDKSQEKVS